MHGELKSAHKNEGDELPAAMTYVIYRRISCRTGLRAARFLALRRLCLCRL
jgi:hypothetical protein